MRCFSALALSGVLLCAAQEEKPNIIFILADDQKKAWSDPAIARQEDPDFLIQGEYGSAQPGAVTGVQVVALGDGKFDAYVLQGGLPGLGWARGMERVVIKGARGEKEVAFDSNPNLKSQSKP